MRIRRSASRLLGSAYSSSPPPYASSSSAGTGCCASTSRELCELNRSPWDLFSELGLSDPQEDLVEECFVNIACRATWLLGSMPAVKAEAAADDAVAANNNTEEQHEVAKKETVKKTKKDGEKVAVKGKKEANGVVAPTGKNNDGVVALMGKKNDGGKVARVKEEAKGVDGGKTGSVAWTCKKSDGKRWHCSRPVSRPNSLCEYHLAQSRSYYNSSSNESRFAAAASTAATTISSSSSKARKRKAGYDDGVGEDFYYYAGFGPFRSKRHCGGSMHEAAVAKQDIARDDDDLEPCDIAGIAGGDEESSGDDGGDDAYGCVDNGELRPGDGGGGRTSQWKKGRKPVKARSLKSLL